MKLYIPEIKDQLVLIEDWKFTLYPEKRNEKLGIKLGICQEGISWAKDWKNPSSNSFVSQTRNYGNGWKFLFTYDVILPVNTILQVDRIYIRKGNSEYSSITFYIKNGDFKGARFWAKLDEVNNINFKKND